METTNLASEYFKSHPDANVLFMTSDQQFFFESGNAFAHAKSLPKTDVKKFTREDGESEESALDLTSKAVYTPDPSLFAGREDDLQFAKVIEDKPSASEIEALEDMSTEKTTVFVEPSQQSAPLNEEQKESIAQGNEEKQEAAEELKDQQTEIKEETKALDEKLEELEQETDEKKAELKSKAVSKPAAKAAPKKAGK